MMKKLIKLFSFMLLITAFSGSSVSAQNLIVNGDFISGNSGFTSGYSNIINLPPTGIKGAYDIVTNPKVWFTPFDACPDHTTGTGRMMVVDGSDVNNTKLWEQTVTVVPGKTYQFSYYLQSLTVGFPARIEILINGVSLGLPNTAPATTCSWAQRIYSWNSGVSTSAIITIYDREISGGGNDFAIDDLSLTACPNPPIVTTPVYICQNSPSIPLTATASVGSTLIWHGTSSSGGIPSLIAPTPSTTVGTTTYYVSQTDGICESSRTPIVVNVVADNGAFIVNYGCDPGQIVPVSAKPTSVLFDWSNSLLIPDNSYNYTYTTTGGLSGSGNVIVSHYQVSGMLPGQSATIVLTAATHPCATQTWTCTLPCITTTTPTFTQIPPFCSGKIPAPLLPASSNEGITGTWSPAIINNTTSGVYTFTPDPILFPCALTQTMPITVDPLVTPAFSGIPAVVCQGATAPILPSSSSNVTPITGTWSPATVSTAVLGTQSYTFTPNPGQCTSATPTTISIRTDPVLTPVFTAVSAICSGTTLSALPTTSLNSITGTWAPALNNTATTTYTFTPTAGQCATTATMTINVNPNVTPLFTPVSAICSGAGLSPLPTTSTNGITGTWSPTLNNTATTTYTFTPTAGQCATTTTLTITVNPIILPNFAAIPALCSGSIAPILATTSPNGIVGTWSPTTINNTTNGSYTFTPSAGQCSTTQILNVTITPRVVTNFATIPAFCSGSTAPILGATSPNGVSGTWSPATISNTTSGSYLFTPNATECATTQTLNVVVNPLVDPNFVDFSICSGSTPPNLDTTSPNGITGTWLPSSIDNTTSGAYVFTPDTPQCATAKTINVTVNPSNTLVAVDWIVTEAFTQNQIVTITATDAGNYLYQMDSGLFQTSPIFENVASGMHSITVKDVNDCSTPITDNNVLVIGYPKFFTPNGDTYNDTWNIVGLKDQLNSRIYIFDRYGKLLKDISPNGAGWDGNYTGHPMPATDYWFTVEYTEQGVTKKFKSHFSLKR
jgi:gliding motility-associated-like protein